VLDADRHWDVLAPPRGPGAQRRALAEAASLLGDWQLQVAGVAIDGPRLAAWASAPADEPLLRFVREEAGRAIDLPDLLLFLDDVLREGSLGLRGETVWLTPGRARSAGVLVHPDDVFGTAPPRHYGVRGPVPIDRPVPQLDLPPARDGDPPSPNWTARYRNPADEAGMLGALSARSESAAFAGRIEVLLAALREAGASVSLNSTVRSPERGYLMWGAFLLSRCETEPELEAAIALLEERNAEWQRNVPIEWRHRAGWRETREAAREMADTYQVVYASEDGARASDHYTGSAVDLTAVALPRELILRAPDGTRRRFDLSASDETRDLSLSPELIDWVEVHYALRKLESDYPHWTDAVRTAPFR
jgi:hypothetical protein